MGEYCSQRNFKTNRPINQLLQMHEISLVESIINIVLDEIPKYNITKVTSITLKVGAMTLVVPDALRFGFQILSQDTPLEGAEIIIENVPTTGRCRACGNVFPIDDWFENCPKCEKMDIEIISGKEMEIINFEGY